MRSQLVVAAMAFAFALSYSPQVEARPRPSHGHGKKFQANKGFGLGLMIGVPTGLSGKYYLSSDTAIDFGFGSFYRGENDGAFNIHADFLWHPFVLATPDPFWLSFYAGLGGRVLSHYSNRREFRDDSHIGLRAPIGLLLDFNRVPLDVFFEAALTIDLITDRGHNVSGFNGALGIRYYFN